MYPHRIHLREPWQRRSSTEVVYSRAFRWPNPLLPYEELWLVTGAILTPYRVKLNQQFLGEQRRARVPLEVAVSGVLQPQNLLEIECLEPPPATAVRQVYLEVRRQVHLQDIRGKTLWEAGRPRLVLEARLQGIPERPLSVVVRLNQREVHYQELGKAMGSIQLITPPLEVRRWVPGEPNELQELELQLLDPACSLSQHHYLTGFVWPEELSRNEAAPGPCERLPEDEGYVGSHYLEQADREGRVIELPTFKEIEAWVWHHPSIRVRSEPVAASPRAGLRYS